MKNLKAIESTEHCAHETTAREKSHDNRRSTEINLQRVSFVEWIFDDLELKIVV